MQHNQFAYATKSQQHRRDARLLTIEAQNRNYQIGSLNALNKQFSAGDVVVVNDAATLPAALQGFCSGNAEKFEIRLVRELPDSDQGRWKWQALTFAEGSWKNKTEERTNAPKLEEGDKIIFSSKLRATVTKISSVSNRLLEIEFSADKLSVLPEMYKVGSLIQYSYLERDLDIWDGQTIFATNPVALEAPSASFQLTWELVSALKAQQVEVLSITHAAGISSTGEESLDRLLPFAERSVVSDHTAKTILQAKKNGGRVIALGTSVVRALESSALESGRVSAYDQETTLRISGNFRRRVVDGLLTGMHELHTSHLELLQSFAPLELIEKSYAEASAKGFLWHEYGDLSLVWG